MSRPRKEDIANEFDGLTVTELREIIADTILTDEDKQIAELRFVKLLSRAKVAEIVLLDIRTVASREKFIIRKLKATRDKRM